MAFKVKKPARGDRRSGLTPDRLPSISVIIPTKDRPEDLEEAVASLLQQTVLPAQLIIVDQSLSDVSRRRVERQLEAPSLQVNRTFTLSYLHEADIPGAAVARNRGMEVAHGEIWLFLDDDVVLEADFLEALRDVYVRRPEVGGVSGIITNYLRPSFAFRLWAWIFARGPFRDERQPIYWNMSHIRRAEPIVVTKFGSGLMSFRAEVIRELRFDHTLRGVPRSEDIDFCARLAPGTLLIIAPQARLVHKQSPAARTRDYWLQAEVSAAFYVSTRPWFRGLKNRLSFSWMIVGYTFFAVAASLHHRSWTPWRALRAGLRERNRGGVAGAPATLTLSCPTDGSAAR